MKRGKGIEMKDYIWILLTACAFGTMEIALKIGSGDFTALQLTFLRFLIGGLVLLPFAIADLHRRNYALTRHDVGMVAMLAVINVVFSMTLFQLSVEHCNANLAAVLISINPMFTMIFAHFIVGEHLTLKKGIVLAICMCGLVLVANPMHLAKGNEPIGIVMGVGASLLFGLYTALSKRCVKRIGGMTLNSLSFIIGAIGECGVLLALGEPIIENVSLESIEVLAYTGLVVTGFGYFCFMKAIEHCGAAAASYAFFIKPIIAMVLAAVILGETITWNIALGIVIILAGCLYNVYQPKKLSPQ